MKLGNPCNNPIAKEYEQKAGFMVAWRECLQIITFMTGREPLANENEMVFFHRNKRGRPYGH